MRSVAFWAVSFLVACCGLPAGRAAEPPRNIEVAEVAWEKLSDREVGEYGKRALEMDADKWRHSETPSYVLHFRRLTEARKVARELEFNLWFVADLLQVKTDGASHKGHAYIFEDTDEWVSFLASTDLPVWSESVAVGDELFLNVRSRPSDRRFNSGTLAHEATHAAVARLYPERPWPLWLNEGFAEYVGAAGVAARKNQTVGRHQADLAMAGMRIEEIVAIESEYPKKDEKLAEFYQSADRLVRFLIQALPAERFPKFVDAILGGRRFEDAVLHVYGDKVADMEALRTAYSKFKP